jgi:hypothetical protein
MIRSDKVQSLRWGHPVVSYDNHICLVFIKALNKMGNQSFFYSPTDAQVRCLKNNFKIYIKIDVKTAPTCFGLITVIREHIIRAC